MNRDARKVDLMRITQENQGLLKRIQTAQPVYNHVEWSDSHRKNQVYMKNACEYPPSLHKKRLPAIQNGGVSGVSPQNDVTLRSAGSKSFGASSGPVAGVSALT